MARYIDDGELGAGDSCPDCEEDGVNSTLVDDSVWATPTCEDEWPEGFRDVYLCRQCGLYIIIEDQEQPCVDE